MPYKTRYGKHYHMEEGCHGATIPCGTNGLSPCSDCCGTKGGGGDPHGTGVPPAGAGTGTPADETAEDDRVEAPDARAEARDANATESPAARSAGIAEAGRQAMAEGQSAPSIEIPEGALAERMPAGDESGEVEAGERDEPQELVDRDGRAYKVAGLGYEGRGQGWPKKKRGKRYYCPGGNGYSYMTRRQAGIVYGAIKRGEVTLDRQHTKEMYDLVGTPWSDMDVRERSIFLHLGSAIDHIIAGRPELAQAELDGRHTEERQRLVGMRQVEVTDDNWLDFAFDFDHDYEIGDMAEEEVYENVWEVTEGSWS